MNIYESGSKIIIENAGYFNLRDTFECGQYLNFNRLGENDYETAAFGKYLRAYQKDGKIYLETSREDFENIWRAFFDLDRDYAEIFGTLRSGGGILEKAADFSSGVRILRQDPFECLISFIISQNNNIPRIKKIVAKLCGNFGEKYKFPAPATLAGLTLGDLAVIKSGFRAKYILDAAKKINSGEINLDLIYDMSVSGGAQYLKKIYGVGDKVASCVLLFAYNKLDAFPVDVWIKKVLAKYYPGGFDFGEYAGVANAYLFYYEREKEKGGVRS
jgi:N-glycosylase/DNA lyase